jgi:hypothetical protein
MLILSDIKSVVRIVSLSIIRHKNVSGAILQECFVVIPEALAPTEFN